MCFGRTGFAHSAIISCLVSACSSTQPTGGTLQILVDSGKDAAVDARGMDAARTDTGRLDARPSDYTRATAPDCYAKADALVGYIDDHRACQRDEDCAFTVLDVLTCMLPDEIDPDADCRGNIAMGITADVNEIQSRDHEIRACLGGFRNYLEPSCTKINGTCCPVSCGGAPTLACVGGTCEIVPSP